MIIASLAFAQIDESDATDGDGKFMVYDLLNEKQKRTYDQLYDLVMNLGDSIDCRHLTHKETVDMYYGFMSDHPDIYWFQTDYHFYVFDDTGGEIYFNKE
jgi:hypothetical protein